MASTGAQPDNLYEQHSKESAKHAEERAATARVIASRSIDTLDATMLLDVLGIARADIEAAVGARA